MKRVAFALMVPVLVVASLVLDAQQTAPPLDEALQAIGVVLVLLVLLQVLGQHANAQGENADLHRVRARVAAVRGPLLADQSLAQRSHLSRVSRVSLRARVIVPRLA